jgi:hypothetical protein
VGESPGVYLFIAWALTLWLRDCPAVGIRATEEGELLRGDQFADDTHPFLPSLVPEVVGQFLAAMEIFGLASNQHLNCDKTKLLPVGDWSTIPPPSEVCGLKVVSQAVSLGVPFSNDPNGPVVD